MSVHASQDDTVVQLSGTRPMAISMVSATPMSIRVGVPVGIAFENLPPAFISTAKTYLNINDSGLTPVIRLTRGDVDLCVVSP
jgi:hypothetical protein